MTRTQKIWLGIFTFLPFALLIGYFIAFFTIFINVFDTIETNSPDMQPTLIAGKIKYLLLTLFPSIILGTIIMIYYIIHANKNPKNDSNKKLMWTLILIFTSTIGSIVYYFIEIIPLGKDSDSSKPIEN